MRPTTSRPVPGGGPPPDLDAVRRPRRTRRRTPALVGAVSAVLALLVAGLATSPATADPGTPLSQGKLATSSADEGPAFPPSAAVDGDPGTRWSSAHADGQWIQVDLGEVAQLERIELDWETAYASGYTIDVSADASSWTTVVTQTAGTGGQETHALATSARYVRLAATERATPWGVSLWELRVFGPGGGTVDPPDPTTDQVLSYGRTGTASSSQHDGNCWQCTPDKAFDLDPASRWATDPDTGWVDEGWIAVDLGATADISRVVLQWDPAYATGYDIEVSPDGVAWQSVYSTTSGAGFKETIDLAATGRHVRVHMNTRSGPYGYSLWEFQVYGTGGAPIAPPAQPADPDFENLTLVWSDEFDAPAGSAPDPTRWTIDPGMPENNELQHYTPSGNAWHDGDGNLVIEARREASAGRDFTSHRMNTSESFNTQYGRFEARIKVPEGRGFWPAFWMMGSDFLEGRPWPYNGEIDIMEFIGQDPYTAHSTLHAPAYWGAGGYGGSYTLPSGAKISDDFHVWAAEWDSAGIRYFLDDQEVFYASKETVESTRGPWVYDHDFYMILNLAVGGDWPGPPDASTPFPSQMLVDYVRVFQ